MGCGICFSFCRTIESCFERGPSPTRFLIMKRGLSFPISGSLGNPQGPSGVNEMSKATRGMRPAASPRAGGLMEETEKGVQAPTSDTRAPLLLSARPAGLH